MAPEDSISTAIREGQAVLGETIQELRAQRDECVEVLLAVAPLIESIDRMLEGWNGPGSKSPLGPLVRKAIARAQS